jgi:hypothetical protein
MTGDPIVELDAGFSAEDGRATPWATALELLEKAEVFWLSTGHQPDALEVPSEREPSSVGSMSVARGQSHPNAESGGAGERR